MLRVEEAWNAIAKTAFHLAKQYNIIPINSNSQEDFEKFLCNYVIFLFPVIENGKLVDTETRVYPIAHLNLLRRRPES